MPSVTGTPPVLLYSILCAADTAPWAVSGKLRLVGKNLTAGGKAPWPLSTTCAGALLKLPFTVTEPLYVPVPCGANVICSVQPTLTASVGGQLFPARLNGAVTVTDEMVAGFEPLLVMDMDFAADVVISAVVSKVNGDGVKLSMPGAVPVPESMTLVFVLLTGSVRVPLRGLTAEGVKETVMVQPVVLTGSDAGHPFDTSAKSDALAPLTTGVPSCAALPPEFTTLTARFLAVPCCCDPKETGFGANEMTGGGTPLPLSDAVACPLGTLNEGTVSRPERLPVVVGAKAILREQLALPTSVEPQPFAVIW